MKKALILLVVMLAGVLPAGRTLGQPRVLSLQEAVDVAISGSTSVGIYRERLYTARQNVLRNNGLFLPNFNASFYAGHSYTGPDELDLHRCPGSSRQPGRVRLRELLVFAQLEHDAVRLGSERQDAQQREAVVRRGDLRVPVPEGHRHRAGHPRLLRRRPQEEHAIRPGGGGPGGPAQPRSSRGVLQDRFQHQSRRSPGEGEIGKHAPPADHHEERRRDRAGDARLDPESPDGRADRRRGFARAHGGGAEPRPRDRLHARSPFGSSRGSEPPSRRDRRGDGGRRTRDGRRSPRGPRTGGATVRSPNPIGCTFSRTSTPGGSASSSIGTSSTVSRRSRTSSARRRRDGSPRRSSSSRSSTRFSK